MPAFPSASACWLTLPLTITLGAPLACRPRPTLPILGHLRPFSLATQQGPVVSLDSLAGKVWVADFIFTRCGGICPAMTARMVRLRKQVAPSTVFVSFTVDPEHDTAEVLARYARESGASGEWLFATGPREALYALSTGGFKLAAMEVPPAERQSGGDGPFLHSSRFCLVDGQGRVRGYYDSGDEEAVRRLVGDAARLEEDRR